MKKIIFGVVIGVLLSSTVAYGASVIKSAYFNEDIKLAINGTVTSVQAITVQLEGETNGKNYFAVSDISDSLNKYANLNATYSFDSKSKTINVTVGQALKSVSMQKVSAPSIPDKPTETLQTGMEWVWYTEGNYAEWSIKYNGNIYVNEFSLKQFGYRTSLKMDSKGKLSTVIESTSDNSKYIPYHNEIGQAIQANHGAYTNLNWIKSNI